MRRAVSLFAIWVALILVGVSTPDPAGAQQSPRAEVRAELARTGRAIDRGRDHLRETHCAQGRRYLDRAVELQRDAEAAFLANTVRSDREAMALTRKARELVAQAVQTCQAEFQAHETVRRLFGSTRDLARELESRLRQAEDPEANHLWKAGLDQLEKAREDYRLEHYRQAIRRATVARNLIQRGLARIGRGQGRADAALRVDRAIARTDRIIEEAARTLGPDPGQEAESLLEQARGHQDRARRLRAEEKAGAALRLTELARSKAMEAGWLAKAIPERERVTRALELLEQMLAEIGPEIRVRGGSEAAALIEKVEEQIAESRIALADGELKRAAGAARSAGGLLRRAAERSGLR